MTHGWGDKEVTLHYSYIGIKNIVIALNYRYTIFVIFAIGGYCICNYMIFSRIINFHRSFFSNDAVFNMDFNAPIILHELSICPVMTLSIQITVLITVFILLQM